MSLSKRKDVSYIRDGDLIVLQFNQTAADLVEITKQPQEEIDFSDAELEILHGIFKRGEEEGFFAGYGVMFDQSDCRRFCFFGCGEGEYRTSLMSVVKGMTPSGETAYAVQPSLGSTEEFQDFASVSYDLNSRIDDMITRREENRDRAARSARLGQSLKPLHLV